VVGEEGVTPFFDVKMKFEKNPFEKNPFTSWSQCDSAKVAQTNILSMLILPLSQSSPPEVKTKVWKQQDKNIPATYT